MIRAVRSPCSLLRGGNVYSIQLQCCVSLCKLRPQQYTCIAVVNCKNTTRDLHSMGGSTTRYPIRSPVLHLLRPLSPHSAPLISIRHLSVDQKASDAPIPFLKSKAGRLKAEDLYAVDYDPKRRQRYVFPFALLMFGAIVYFGFLRDYGTEDKAVVEFLTQDISSKIPEGAREEFMRSAGETSSEGGNDGSVKNGSDSNS